MDEACQKCGAATDGDHRTLMMKCGYEMSELKIPFIMHEMESRRFYTLRVCKDCRSDWMRSIQYWFNTPMPREPCGSGIYVRDFGSNREITLEEYREKYDND